MTEPMNPNSSVLTSDLAHHRDAERHRLRRFARTTRLPTAIRPSVFPFVRAIISGA